MTVEVIAYLKNRMQARIIPAIASHYQLFLSISANSGQVIRLKNTFSYVAGKMGAAAAFDSYLALPYNLSCFFDGLCRLRKDPALFRNQPLTFGDGGKIFQKIEETAIDSLQG